MGAGEYLEIPFSGFADPEGEKVYFRVTLRDATPFAYFDYEAFKLIIEKRSTVYERDAGNYTITVELNESIDGVQIPPRKW